MTMYPQAAKLFKILKRYIKQKVKNSWMDKQIKLDINGSQVRYFNDDLTKINHYLVENG